MDVDRLRPLLNRSILGISLFNPNYSKRTGRGGPLTIDKKLGFLSISLILGLKALTFVRSSELNGAQLIVANLQTLTGCLLC